MLSDIFNDQFSFHSYVIMMRNGTRDMKTLLVHGTILNEEKKHATKAQKNRFPYLRFSVKFFWRADIVETLYIRL